MPASADDLKALVRTITDFPKAGIEYRDITTLLLDRVGLAAAVEAMAASVAGPIELPALGGARALGDAGVQVASLMAFDGA